MARIALVGYKGEIVEYLIPKFIRELGHNLCYNKLVEDRNPTETTESLVRKMLSTEPNFLHFADHRNINETELDEEYIDQVLKQTKIPILLTSSYVNLSNNELSADQFAKRKGIFYLRDLNLKNYKNIITELVV